MDLRNIAEAYPPGDFLKEELESRGWTQRDLAIIMGRDSKLVSDLVTGKRSFSADIASQLAAALGTSPQIWMNLETAYHLAQEEGDNDDVVIRRKLYEIAPISDMIRRGWIKGSEDVSELNKQVLHFLGIQSLDEYPRLDFAAKARASTSRPPQIAWISRAQKLAPAVYAEKFTQQRFKSALAKLKELMANPEDARHVPKVLAEGGVRFLLIEHLPKGKIDGACFWLDKHSPVIAMSMRYDRLDHFWYILTHECGHVVNRDALGAEPHVDIDLVGDGGQTHEDRPDIEKKADEFAEDFIVEQRQMEKFIARVRPLYSKQKIKNFAARLGIHPAMVLGQLQHRREVDWSHSREMLVRVRDILLESALADGWGHQLPSDY